MINSFKMNEDLKIDYEQRKWDNIIWKVFSCDENGAIIWWENNQENLYAVVEIVGEIRARYECFENFKILSDNEMYSDSYGGFKFIFKDNNTLIIEGENKEIGVSGVYKVYY